ncbi:MAG: SNF2-related protein [Methylocella sp.]
MGQLDGRHVLIQLDYNPAQDLYVLRAPRSRADELMTEYGLELSLIASDRDEAVLFTPEPYAAVSFLQHGTPEVQERLRYINDRIAASWAPSCDRHIDVPGDRELWAFQRASVDYALSVPHALVADQPGLGKTPIAIAVANEMRAQRILVVCPASIRFQWCRRIAEWSTMLSSYPLDEALLSPHTGAARIQAVTTSQRGLHDKAAWTVISWDLVRSPGIWRALVKGEYDLLILDEAHYAKTISAARTRAVFGGGRNPVADPLVARSLRTLALTGTPLPNRPREAYVLAYHLCPDAIDYLSERAFNERFNPKNMMKTASNKVWTDERVGRAAELQNRLRGNFMVRHLKRDVMTQLKMPVYDLIRVEETRAVKAALAAEKLLDIDPEHLEGADAETLGHIAEARRLMGVAMAPQVADYVAMLIEGGEDKLVVFAWHVEVLDIICAALGKYGIVRVDGRDGAVRKDAKVRSFIERPELRVIAGNILSLGTGTDGLQDVCSHALLAEADWTMGNNEQAFDRLDRGGQRNQVLGEIFVAPGSLSEKVLAAALRKGAITHKALDRRVA